MRSRISLPQFTGSLCFRLTAWQCLVLVLTLAAVSASVVGGLYLFLNHQAVRDINVSRQATLTYLAGRTAIDSSLLEENLLTPGVELLVYNQQGQVVLDSSPFMTGQRQYRRGPRFAREIDRPPLRPREFIDSQNDQTYIRQEVEWGNGSRYLLQFRRDITGNIVFLKALSVILAAVCLLAATVAGYVSWRISCRSLGPLHQFISVIASIRTDNFSPLPADQSAASEIAALRRRFNAMLDRLRQGFEQEREFSLAAAHELRTPLTIIAGNIDLIRRWGDQRPDIVAGCLEVIRREAGNMQEMLDHLLTTAQSGDRSLTLNYSRFCLTGLARAVCGELQLVAPGHRIACQGQQPLMVTADQARIRQLIMILLDNAAKFSPPGPIEVECRQTSAHCHLSVADHGPGIPPAEQEKVFHRLYRSDRSRSLPGHGLGLALARTIAAAHHGRLIVDPDYRQGCRMVLSLPLLPPAGGGP
ncbi:MAG: HAMP domain-containing histidine kinase [Negativicutes bacterium]|nr:HAMP domain-containing histidine kinase [Negativicutes bacterium]